MITGEERKRYARQMLMIGEDGQERLKAASVLVAGAGGLGTVISLYLSDDSKPPSSRRSLPP